MICFICSPSLGILDNWLPVIEQIRKLKPEIEFLMILPKANSVDLIDTDNILIKIAQKIFKRIVFRTHSGMWLQVDSFERAIKINRQNSYERYAFTIAHRLSMIFPNNALTKLIHYIHNKAIGSLYSDQIVSLKETLSPVNTVLYDVYEEIKPYLIEILYLLKKAPKYSLCHGINIDQEPIVERIVSRDINERVCAYLFSKDEREYYKRTFDLAEKNLRIVGIPRHDSTWIETIEKKEKEVHGNLDLENYIFVISRSLSPYFTYERKLRAIKDIRRLCHNELNKNIVVKLHPKERYDGIFHKVLGCEEYGKSWRIINTHPFAIAKKADFAISFYSGVCIDMIAQGVPVVEYLDLKGLKEYDHKNSLRDKNGEPVFSYRHIGFVLGASDYQSLHEKSRYIIENKEKVIQKLQKIYREKFQYTQNLSRLIAGQITEHM